MSMTLDGYRSTCLELKCNNIFNKVFKIMANSKTKLNVTVGKSFKPGHRP